MDFTIQTYKVLLQVLKEQKYAFQTFEEFIKNPKKKVVILRHDVDLLPYHSLRFAKIQNELGIKGVYYFRAVPESWDEKVIKEIVTLGHEVGYHYETMDTANGDIDKGWDQFKDNLNELRKVTQVSTVCMHGSPRSKYDNKDIWKKYDYKSLGIIGEPYYDIDFNQVLYLTDTGRMWDGYKVSVRDKVNTTYLQTYHTTQEIIEAINNCNTPHQIMFNFHPQRWHDNAIQWTKELILQNAKNLIKKYFFVSKKQGMD